MDELSTSYSVGLEWEMMFGNFETSIEVLHDISGEESGQEAELSFAYPKMIAGFEVRPGLSLTWMSKEKVDYLYGVSAREVRLNRPVYKPESSLEVGMEIMVQRTFFDNFTFVGLMEISKFGSEVKNSPIVDNDFEIGGALGVMYNF
jgi:outer membrane protein